MTPAVVHDGQAATLRDARQRVLLTADAAHPERFVRTPPHPPVLPHAVWMNPPKKQSASQDGAGAAISTADGPRVALNVAGLEVLSKTVIVSSHTITPSTDEVLHYMPTASVPNSLTRSGSRRLSISSAWYALLLLIIASCTRSNSASLAQYLSPACFYHHHRATTQSLN